MNMSISRDLFLAILSMDSCNRGYDAGVSSLSDIIGTKIGNGRLGIDVPAHGISGTGSDPVRGWSSGAGPFAV